MKRGNLHTSFSSNKKLVERPLTLRRKTAQDSVCLEINRFYNQFRAVLTVVSTELVSAWKQTDFTTDFMQC